MSRGSSISPSKPDRDLVWLICVLLGISGLNAQTNIVLTAPRQVSLSPNFSTQQLSVSWLGGAATTFDLIILRTEFNETVFYETVSATVNRVSGQHQWTWTSKEPLECTSLSVKICSRDGQTTSEWSETQILQGYDLPSKRDFQMYPQDRVVPVGANTTFCCIVEEGKTLKRISYGSTEMVVKNLSRRSYAVTAVNQGPSRPSGANVICQLTEINKIIGAVVFVGYPPLPTDFVCQTHDLQTSVCQWNKGRDTRMYGRRQTRYYVNGRNCTPPQRCSLPEWYGNWTLVAVNPVGQYSLTDSAELSHRVCPVAPVKLNRVVHAWNATVFWEWTSVNYSSLALVCQVELTSQGYKTKRVFSGSGLQSVVLLDLQPNENYSVQVRCGSQKNFWKWGNWSEVLPFTTKTYVPDAPDVWMWMNRDNTGLVVWKRPTPQQSHGQITGFEVTLWNAEENLQRTQSLSPDDYSLPVNLTQMASFSNDNEVIATVITQNVEGSSQPASVPLRLIDMDPPVFSRTAFTDSGFPLTWQQNASTTCSYLIEWLDASCRHDCQVEWIRVNAGSTNVSIETDTFQPGVRYNFSLYSCPSSSPLLIQRWQGYLQELVPSSSVRLSVSQQGSDAVLTWEEIPLADRRGFLLGYNVYISHGSELLPLAKLSDHGTRKYIVKDLDVGSYKFTVKAYTSAGEDTGTTVSIMMEPGSELILSILVSLGIVTLLLSIVSFICCKKRKWVKRAFYPDIPEPKLPGDWSRTRGPLDVKPSPHSMVHIVEKSEQDSFKDALVVIPEEEEDDEGQGIGDEPVDTDEPQSLRYYNQMVDERPIRPRFPDSSVSSASSMDSASTDVTYTGIQTSCSSLVFQQDPQSASEGHQPDADHSVSCGSGGGGYRPQMHPIALSDNIGLASPEPLLEPQAVSSGGYKPQNSWHIDSPTEEERNGLAPSLGSPVSVASTQFLLLDEEDHSEEKQQPPSSAATWLSNLLSSSKP
ncbi:LIF receptor subunit alpha a [Kryptolebias marmoratus]|uniref:LIF receptor subunit alpha a n=1 Tax=Kryptolebias marmoratus TaxID=37003 RepID=A0A3Q2ZGZ7_KRYMA|nr:LIF receptor subunit alpha a [Kryptolebias marmoratus]XP_037831789.1 LIF receptor subunit alpha a [Kryptolebias marmoratus]